MVVCHWFCTEWFGITTKIVAVLIVALLLKVMLIICYVRLSILSVECPDYFNSIRLAVLEYYEARCQDPLFSLRLSYFPNQNLFVREF